MVHDELPKYLLATLKQRTEKQPGRQEERLPGSRLTGWFALRLLVRQPAADDGDHTENPMERRNKRTGRREKARIWEVRTERSGPGLGKRLPLKVLQS